MLSWVDIKNVLPWNLKYLGCFRVREHGSLVNKHGCEWMPVSSVLYARFPLVILNPNMWPDIQLSHSKVGAAVIITARIPWPYLTYDSSIIYYVYNTPVWSFRTRSDRKYISSTDWCAEGSRVRAVCVSGVSYNCVIDKPLTNGECDIFWQSNFNNYFGFGFFSLQISQLVFELGNFFGLCPVTFFKLVNCFPLFISCYLQLYKAFNKFTVVLKPTKIQF